FLFCTLFFVIGANAVFAKKVFSVGRNIRYLLVGIVYFSVALAFISAGSFFPWGGEFGKLISEWLSVTIGKIGTAAILLVGGIAYVIWRFNPVIKVPDFPKQKKPAVEGDVLLDPYDKSVLDEVDGITEPVIKEPTRGRGKKIVAPPLDAPAEHDLKLTRKLEDELANPAKDFEIGDDDEEDLPVEIKPEPVLIRPNDRPMRKPQGDIELEIHTGPEKEEEEDEFEKLSDKLPVNTAPYEPTLDLRDYKYPALDLLETHGSEKIIQDPAELEANKNQIINTLKNYDISIQKISATVGPTVTLYEIVPAAGVRISRIKNLEDDIALSLAALGIRIIAPIPGKGTIGIEVPNVKKTVVSMKSLLASEKFQMNNFSLPIAIGKKIDNDNFIVDLTTMPHLLMAGATGQGKSVGLNAILVSLLYKKHPSQLKFVLVDPKKVELSLYRTIEKHFLAKLPGEEDAIITDTKKVVHTLNALCIEMDTRYDLLKEAGARNIKEYNEKFVKRKLNPEKGHQFLPFIVLVVDEFADLIMTAGKEVEMPIARLAQLARAIGIHLIIATQRPSVNIITGTIKANFPARIAFKVSSKVDSRTILDTGGAEQLIGKGDMLISYNGELTRLQCAFVDTPEVEGVCDFIGDQRGYAQAFMLPEYVDEKDMEGKDFDIGNRDALFEDAARLIVQSQIGSTSLLQRRMKLGYNRAGRLMDQLEASGVVGPSQGSKARDVLIKTEADLERHLVDQLG
ncbi:MAG: DNA translocase FtsK, partial [Chitinophagaceae bacterium]